MECGKCGRELKDRKSIERGYGPKCWRKIRDAEEEKSESN
ncbi:DUF6011 domain-containing protein [Salibacterium aidingense]